MLRFTRLTLPLWSRTSTTTWFAPVVSVSGTLNVPSLSGRMSATVRVHGAGRRHVVAVLECLEELLADARVRRRLVERDAALLALRAKDLAQLRHLGVVTSA